MSPRAFEKLKICILGMLRGQRSGSNMVVTQRSNECSCSSHARAILARVGMGCIISIETSKRQNGGRFKFRGICFQLAGIRWRQNS